MGYGGMDGGGGYRWGRGRGTEVGGVWRVVWGGTGMGVQMG